MDVSTLRSALILPRRSAGAYLRRDRRRAVLGACFSRNLPVVVQSIHPLLRSTVTWTNSSARSNPASLESDAVPGNVPKCGQKAATAYLRSTVLTDRPASVRQCVDFSATYIDHALASALLLRSSSPQVGDSVVGAHQAVGDLLKAFGGAVPEAGQNGLRELLVGKVASAHLEEFYARCQGSPRAISTQQVRSRESDARQHSKAFAPLTGEEYLESLRDSREVYVYGERVEDVTRTRRSATPRARSRGSTTRCTTGRAGRS